VDSPPSECVTPPLPCDNLARAFLIGVYSLVGAGFNIFTHRAGCEVNGSSPPSNKGFFFIVKPLSLPYSLLFSPRASSSLFWCLRVKPLDIHCLTLWSVGVLLFWRPACLLYCFSGRMVRNCTDVDPLREVFAIIPFFLK